MAHLKLTLGVFKRPPLALIVVALCLLGSLLAVVPVDVMDKFGFTMAMGIGVFFFVQAGKAVATGNESLAVLMVFASIPLVILGSTQTSSIVLTGNVLDDHAATILSAIASIFSNLGAKRDGGE